MFPKSTKLLLVCALLLACTQVEILRAMDAVTETEELPTWQESAVATTATLVEESGKRGFKHWLRSKVYSTDADSRYGLKLEEGWEQAAQDLPVVVLVHGYNSSPENNAELLSIIRQGGFPCAGFAYPNDFYVKDSAQRLSRELRAFNQLHKNRRLALVTHSMGGLVALECLENKQLNPGNIDRLIMIAPPVQGSMLAQVAVATDVWEHWLGRSSGGPWARWKDSVIDGLGEAADDLVPGSPFLTRLNSRSRNPKVQYTIFLGTGAGVAQDEMDWLRGKLRNTIDLFPGTSKKAEQLDQLLAEMDELIDGKGDGIVAVKRGKLSGVEDVVVLPFGHLSVTDKADDDVVRQVQQGILERLH